MDLISSLLGVCKTEADVEEKRIRMKAVSETARGWAEALKRELEGWPGVTLKSAFGMTMAYRKGVVFGALPRTRALFEEDAILLKFNRESRALTGRIGSEPRFVPGTMEERHGNKKKGGEGRRWRIFLMCADSDMHAAIEWLAEAHRVAAARSKPASLK
jgi:hypothetical protein